MILNTVRESQCLQAIGEQNDSPFILHYDSQFSQTTLTPQT